MDDDERTILELPFHDAMLAAAVFAADPARVGGIIVRAASGPARESWLRNTLSLLDAGAPVRRVPSHIGDESLLGGLDLAMTLATGRPVARHGLLKEADGGIIIIPSAERLSAPLASRIATTMDLGAIPLQRDEFTATPPTCFGIIALDEGQSPEERPPSAVLDRAGLHITLPDAKSPKIDVDTFTRERVKTARRDAASIPLDDDCIRLLCELAAVVAVSSSNAILHAARILRLITALNGRARVSEDDIAATIRLVIAPRATRHPEEAADNSPQPSETSDQQPNDHSADQEEAGQLPDSLIAATKAALPPHLLERLQSDNHRQFSKSTTGKSGDRKKAPRRGRPIGFKAGPISQGARLNIVETLRAAAPWQPLRRREIAAHGEANATDCLAVRAVDFRVWRLKSRGETVTVFVVDASGSTAVQRLGEAKGAVEILLSECYSRRDHAALIAFSGRGSELLLPPTRSLARAKRNLADLPGGGGTPLASGIDAAAELCDAVRRKGQAPSVVVLTDGRANLNRNGKPGRAAAEEDAVQAAKTLRSMGVRAIVIDTSAKPNAPAARLADAMGAKYLPLAYADADTLSKAIKTQEGRSISP